MHEKIRSSVFGCLAVLLGLGLAFTAAETGLRCWHGHLLDHENALEKFVRESRANCLTAFDDKLGWTTERNATVRENIYRTRVTSDGDGFRNLGATARNIAAETPTWLAVGDSFTFGDEVSDDESWPAYLQGQTPDRVINAGVCGFGIDQTLLRAEALLTRLHPRLLIFSLFTLGIDRNELVAYPGIQRATAKPYFTLRNGSLILHNANLEEPPTPELPLSTVHRIVGYSHLGSALMVRLFPRFWNAPLARTPEQRSGENGVEVSCALMHRLSLDSREQRAPVMVLAQYGHDTTAAYTRKMQKVIACARAASLPVLDLMPVFDAMRASDPRRYDSFFGAGHMSAAGNRFVADQVSAFVQRTFPEQVTGG